MVVAGFFGCVVFVADAGAVAASAMRTSIDRAWPSSPSARASVVTVSARPARPALVSVWIDTSFTKSDVCSPPRTRATPAVGSVWFEPMA